MEVTDVLEKINVFVGQMMFNDVNNPERAIHLLNLAADTLEQIVRERDAAVADLKAIESTDDDDLNFCEYCRYCTGEECENPQCNPYDRKSGWEWRGVPQEVERE